MIENFKPDDRFYVIVYVGESADESMFHKRGIGSWNFVKEQLKLPPTSEQLKSMNDNDDDERLDKEGLGYAFEDDELICREDLWCDLPDEHFDFMIEINHKEKECRCFRSNKKGRYIQSLIVPLRIIHLNF